MRIYDPTNMDRFTILYICLASLGAFVLVIVYVRGRKIIREKMLQAKIKRRQSRRSSEESITEKKGGAFKS